MKRCRRSIVVHSAWYEGDRESTNHTEVNSGKTEMLQCCTIASKMLFGT